ncbi:MAG: DedA family protein [Thermodesulfobacteriota bacterium]
MNDLTAVSQLGYLAVFTGTAMEGETVLLLAAAAVHMGYLQLMPVIVVGFLGAVFGDQLFFWMGRLQGRTVLTKFPRLAEKVSKITELMTRHKIKLLLGYRLMLGLRGAVVFALGMGRLRGELFTALNLLVSLVWVIAMATAGAKLAGLMSLFWFPSGNF